MAPPLDFVFGGAFPLDSGTKTFGANQNGTFPNTFFYSDVFDVEIVVDRAFLEVGGVPMEKTTVKSRPAGSDAEFDIIIDDFTSAPTNPFPNGLIGSFGVANLDQGGTMFIDDVFTFNLRDPAGVPVTNYIDEAFDHEINAFVELSQDPDAAKALIETALSHIASAEHAISTVLPQSTVGVQSLTHLHATVWADI